MFFIFLLLIFACGYSYLFYALINQELIYLCAWIPLGIIVALITVVMIVINIFWIGSFTKPKKFLKHFTLRQVVWLVLKYLRIKLVIEGKENIPQGTYVIYSNHKSNMDPLMLYYAMHRKVTAIGKKSLFKTSIMKMVGKCFDAIALDREDDREAAKSIASGIKKVKNGLPIIIFPEGGIKSRETDEMVNLRAGAYKLATKANAPILPCSIIGNSKIKTKKRFEKVIVKIIFHKAIEPQDYENMNTTEIGNMVGEIINNGVKSANI